MAFLYSHGNAEDIGTAAPWLASIAEHVQATFITYDYAGYGVSTGAPSEENVKGDVETVAGIVEKELGFPRDRIFIYGRSLGSGPSCHLASLAAKEEKPYRGVFLQSPLCSAFRVVLPNSMVSWSISIPGDKFPNLDLLKKSKDGFGCPVFVIHGDQDEVINVVHGRTLAAAVPVKWRVLESVFVPGAGHNDMEEVLEMMGKPIEDHLRAFVDACLGEESERGT